MAPAGSHPAQPMAKTPNKKGETKATQKVFADHVSELRMRITWVVLVFIITSAVAYNYRDFLVHLVLSPLGDQKLVYLTPAGGFSFIFQITMYAGGVVTAPLLIYHLYRFVVPALPRHAQRYSLRVITAAILLMLAGVAFGYFVAIPAALHFLTTFAGGYVEANLTADSYLSFILAYVAGLGILFQLPLLLVFWNWMSPLGPKKLFSSERFVIVFAFIAAALMTPTPDVLNQSLIAIPIIAIYQFGVIAVLITNRSKARREKREKKALLARSSIAGNEVMVPDEILADILAPVTSEPAQPIHKPVQQPKPVMQPQLMSDMTVAPKKTPAAAVVQAPSLSSRSIDGVVMRQRPQTVLSRTPQRPQTPVQRGVIRAPMRSMSLDGFL